MLSALQRPQFLLDIAQELKWLNEKAGPEVAERWYEALCNSIEQLQSHPSLGRPIGGPFDRFLEDWGKGLGRSFYLIRTVDRHSIRAAMGSAPGAHPCARHAAAGLE